MKKTVYIAIAAIALVMFSPLPGQAWHHSHGHGHVGVGVWIGPGWWGPYYPYYPYYPYPYYPYYSTPPAVVEQPEEYIQEVPQTEEQSYWYFCKNPKGYYPYVKSCPDGWIKVVPPPAPSDESNSDTMPPAVKQKSDNRSASKAKGQGYWYFCKNPRGYYPYIKSCPDGWIKVVPPQAPSDEEKDINPQTPADEGTGQPDKGTQE